MKLLCLEDLESLQGSLLTSIETLESGGELEQEDESAYTVEVVDQILEFENLLKAAAVSMNYAHRGFKVKWVTRTEKDGCDTLTVLQNESNIRDDREIAGILQDLTSLLEMIDWITEFKKRLRELLKQTHSNKILARDSRRDETIAHNSMLYEVDDTKENTPYNTTNLTTKDKLLNKTKNLSSNLIKGNQILQSGILQSDLNLDELKQQSHNLSNVTDKYTQFETVFSKTNQLVKTLEKASHQEKRDVYLALGFLCLSISWVLWRRIFRLPTKLVLFVLFKFFKTILATMGFVSRVSSKNRPVAAPPVNIPETTQFALDTAVETIEKAVDDAMDRILSHDEL